ncbi:hypothetical protein HMPREF3086_12940 [Dietzia sp. HMSC21D01]|nr:hypothetical protein HMPREF3086_12940 [Dietzia sp. HMSC21D01]
MPSEHENAPVAASAVASQLVPPGPVTVTDAPGEAVPDTVTWSSEVGADGETDSSVTGATVPWPTVTVVVAGAESTPLSVATADTSWAPTDN